jgi:RNA polymerase sigma-70 factor (sigma-E family)
MGIPEGAPAPQLWPVSAARRSAEAGIDALYREHGLGLVRFALLLTGDKGSAEDVVQDAFLGLYRGWDRIRLDGNELAYLRASVMNGSRSVHRARFRARQHEPAAEPPVWSAEAAAIDGEDRRELLAAVAALPTHQREVLVLKFFLDLPEAEVAQIMRVSRGTVSSRAARALTALARRLKEER